jgi:hypothetical protein
VAPKQEQRRKMGLIIPILLQNSSDLFFRESLAIIVLREGKATGLIRSLGY